MKRWIVPYWGQRRLFEVRTIEVECWLRRLPLAKSTCAKIQNLMSVLFNHACRYELYDHNPIHLVRQSAKRKQTPSLLTPAEIKALIDTLGLRERTLVLLATSTGLRQSELFALKWGDIDFAGGTMSVTRSIVLSTELASRPYEDAKVQAFAKTPTVPLRHKQWDGCQKQQRRKMNVNRHTPSVFRIDLRSKRIVTPLKES